MRQAKKTTETEILDKRAQTAWLHLTDQWISDESGLVWCYLLMNDDDYRPYWSEWRDRIITE